MNSLGRIATAVCLVALSARAASALEDDFGAALSASWAEPNTPQAGSSVASASADAAGVDGAVLKLVYPGRTSSSISGPGWATQLQSAASQAFGVYQARMRVAGAGKSQGVVSAFFTYFNDGIDHDGDGIVDNNEIDLEFLAAERSAIYLSVWTEYQDDANGEVFRKTTRKVDLKTGRVWQTPAGGEGTYDLEEIAPLGWKMRRFDPRQFYYSYRFDWQPTQVTFSVDVQDGLGFRTLWTLDGAPDDVIPSHAAPAFFNLWHNAYHWNRDKAARSPARPVNFSIDRVTLP